MDFSDDDVYRSLSLFAAHKTALQKHLHQKVSKLYGRDTSLLYYDVTNYYWETDNEDERRKRGVSKEHRPEPIIQMGLLMDSNELPISYGLFSGNTNDSLTLSPMMEEVDETLKIQGVIYIADSGVISGDNRVEILVNKGGYIFSNPISKTDSATKAYILDEKGYVHLKEGEASFKYKERVIPATVKVTNWATGKKKSVTINERQIVFWGEKYQERARRDRQTAIEKALKYGSSENRHGGNKYFKNTVVNKADGQIIEEKSYIRELDEALLESDEELDGYYLICTNVIGTESDDKPFGKSHRFLKDNLFQLNRPVTSLDIIDMYRGLWRIEESFRITKSYLKTRPIFVRQEESIEAHFLSCFVSLLILRILELKTGRSIELGKMIEDLRNLQVVEETDDVYLLIEPTNIIKAIGDAMDLDLVKVRYTAQELKKLVAKTRR
jgi:transposase